MIRIKHITAKARLNIAVTVTVAQGIPENIGYSPKPSMSLTTPNTANMAKEIQAKMFEGSFLPRK